MASPTSSHHLAPTGSYLFNFQGNVPGRLRGTAMLLDTVGSQGWDDSKELVMWHPVVATSESEYRDVLLQSSFTLCPLGPAQDSYRFWEAIEAGSIPVVLRQDRRSRQATCPAPFADVLATAPPIVLMDSWDDLPIYMEAMTKQEIGQRRKALTQWNQRFWKELVESLDSAAVQYGSPFGNSGDSAADAEKLQHFAEIAAGYAVRVCLWRCRLFVTCLREIQKWGCVEKKRVPSSKFFNSQYLLFCFFLLISVG